MAITKQAPGKAGQATKTVSMAVLNSMVHDARVTKEAETLAKQGYQVTVFCLWEPGLAAVEQHPAGFCIRRIPSKAGFITLATRLLGGRLGKLFSRFVLNLRLYRHLVSPPGEIYHAHDINALPAVWLAAKRTRNPVIYDAHEISSSREGYGGFGVIIRIVEKFFARRCDGMITTTDMRADYFAQQYGIAKPVVLQNRTKFLAKAKGNHLRRILNLDRKSPIVLYQGGIQPSRGTEMILRAAKEFPNAYFIFLGSGSLVETMKGQVTSMGLEDRVRFHAAVPLAELPVLTASADIGIHILPNTCLNHFTTDSNKLFEYLMAGLPVVMSDFPEIRAVVTAHDCGRLVDPENLPAIIKALRELIDNGSELKRLRKNAIQSRKALAWEQQESALVNLYQNVAREKAKGH